MVVDYVHDEVPGRLRIRCRALRRKTEKITAARNRLRSTRGVTSVAANPVTGSFTILYDPARTTSVALLDAWKVNGEPEPFTRGTHGIEHEQLRTAIDVVRERTIAPLTPLIARVVATFVVEKAVERSLLAIVAAVL